jgi:putative peptidoglycan lipid II flippase
MNLTKSIFTVGGMTALSRILGLIREILMSHVIGAGLIADAFIVAFKFPNFFRRFFAEGAFNASFVPEFASNVTKDQKQAKVMAEQVFNFMFWFLLGFVILVEVFTPQIIDIIAPGFSTTPQRQEIAILFTRITFPYILFISICAFFTGILNSINKFAFAAFAPIILNLVMIFSLFFFQENPAEKLSYAVFIAGVIQVVFLYFYVLKTGYHFKIKKPKLTPSVKKILKLMLPAAIGAGIMQINILIDMVLASFLPSGSLSYLYYADRLNQLPLSIFGVAIGTVLLPSLSKTLKNENYDEAFRLQEKAIQMSFELSLPSAFGLIIISYEIIDLIFGHGHFTSADVCATAPALSAFALGLPAYVVGKVFTTAFFAKQDTKTPVKIGAISVLLNLILNLIFISFLKHVGMALATAISAWIQTILLFVILKRKNMITVTKKLRNNLFITLVASVLMFTVVYFSKKIIPIFCIFENCIDECLRIAFFLIIGMVSYFLFLQTFKKFLIKNHNN